jgi:hypothetical protein
MLRFGWQGPNTDPVLQMISYSMNDTMKRLTLATIVFLPLTFLTGYFVRSLQFVQSSLS